MRRVIDAHGRRAEATGARTVHACGFDSIPSDLGVLFTQDRATMRFGEPCTRIGMRVKDASGGFSGGAVASGFATIEELRSDPGLRRILGNPYALGPRGAARRGRSAGHRAPPGGIHCRDGGSGRS